MTHCFINKAMLRQVAFITPGQVIIVKTKERFHFSYYYETVVVFKTKLSNQIYLLGKSMQLFLFLSRSQVFSHFADNFFFRIDFML